MKFDKTLLHSTLHIKSVDINYQKQKIQTLFILIIVQTLDTLISKDIIY